MISYLHYFCDDSCAPALFVQHLHFDHAGPLKKYNQINKIIINFSQDVFHIYPVSSKISFGILRRTQIRPVPVLTLLGRCFGIELNPKIFECKSLVDQFKYRQDMTVFLFIYVVFVHQFRKLAFALTGRIFRVTRCVYVLRYVVPISACFIGQHAPIPLSKI